MNSLAMLLFWVLIQLMQGKKSKKELQQRFSSDVTILGAHTVDARKKAKEGAVVALFEWRYCFGCSYSWCEEKS